MSVISIDQASLSRPLRRLLTPREVAEWLGVTVGTLAVWRSTGRWGLPFVKVGRRVMYEVDAALAWKTTNTRVSGATA